MTEQRIVEFDRLSELGEVYIEGGLLPVRDHIGKLRYGDGSEHAEDDHDDQDLDERESGRGAAAELFDFAFLRQKYLAAS